MTAKPGPIAFQGAHGAYSDLSCRTVYPGRETLPCETFEDAFEAVRRKQADLAMIPVDNTIAGRVADVHHLMPGGGSLHYRRALPARSSCAFGRQRDEA